MENSKVGDRTFFEARTAVEQIREDEYGIPMYFLQMIPPGIYVVIRNGVIVGKGLHFETAIADFESNINCLVAMQSVADGAFDAA